MFKATLRFGIAIPACLLLCVSLSACTREWWTRGQPPAISEVASRAEHRLDEALTAHATARQDFVPLAKELREALKSSLSAVRDSLPNNQIESSLMACRNTYLKLEQSLSPGSRVAYGELSGQMREFEHAAREGKTIAYQSFELFSARTMFFLASELSVPPPVVS